MKRHVFSFLLLIGMLALLAGCDRRPPDGPTIRWKPVTITRFEPKPRVY